MADELRKLFSAKKATSERKITSSDVDAIPDISPMAKIKVVGVGGGGGNALNRMIDSDLTNVDFVAVNTDAQALYYNSAPHKINIGKIVTCKAANGSENAAYGRFGFASLLNILFTCITLTWRNL